MTTEKVVNIVNGPSKFDFMLALFDHPNGAPRREVEFKFRPERGPTSTIRVIVTEVETLDFNDAWHFTATVTNVDPLTERCHLIEALFQADRIRGYFNTRIRMGHIYQRKEVKTPSY